MKFKSMMKTCVLIAVVFTSLGTAQTQSGESGQSKTATKSASAVKPSAANLPVLGSGTAGQIARWTGFSGSAPSIGDSVITEDKSGKIGIGTTSPTSTLTVRGSIETTLGGYRFPDGTVQTTAAVSGLRLVLHDTTLTGEGTGSSPLGIRVPLQLNGDVNEPLIKIRNEGPAFSASSDAIEINDQFFRASQAARVSMTQILTEIRRANAVQVPANNKSLSMLTHDGKDRTYSFDSAAQKLKMITNDVLTDPDYTLANNCTLATFDVDKYQDSGLIWHVNRVSVTIIVKVDKNTIRLTGSAAPRKEQSWQ